jgi:hypothetical protein
VKSGAVETTCGSNGKSELLRRGPAPLGLSLSVYLAEFLAFDRLRPGMDNPPLAEPSTWRMIENG